MLNALADDKLGLLMRTELPSRLNNNKNGIILHHRGVDAKIRTTTHVRDG
jgi:hypothetical protein